MIKTKHVTTSVTTINVDWDATKAASNLVKHKLSFEAAARIFSDPMRVDSQDARKDYGEDRWVAVGTVSELLISVVYTIRDENTLRLISARQANAKERKKYSQIQP